MIQEYIRKNPHRMGSAREKADKNSGVDIKYASNKTENLLEIINACVTKNTVMCEIGSFAGVSSGLFALSCKEIYCVDKWENMEQYNWTLKKSAEKEFDNMAINFNNIQKIKKSSIEASKCFENNFFDFIYIDAGHTAPEVKQDIEAWLPKLKIGGIMGGHDYNSKGVSDSVKSAFKKFSVYKDFSWSARITS